MVVGVCWSVVYLLGATPLEKTFSFSIIHQLSLTLSQAEFLPPRIKMPTSLLLLGLARQPQLLGVPEFSGPVRSRENCSSVVLPDLYVLQSCVPSSVGRGVIDKS